MSSELINHSPDLARLRKDGYDLEVCANHLLAHHVPYVNSKREIRYGSLVSELTLADSVTTAKPGTHVAYFIGEHPCDKNGIEISAIKHSACVYKINEQLTASFSFSNRPPNGYDDYHHKMTRYIEIISNPAWSIDPTCSPLTFADPRVEDDDAIFLYRDTASSRAGIYPITKKLELPKVGIVGLGGTGSYVLDLVAKTRVKEIHLYDGDQFELHNPFRAPGAASVDDVRRKLQKVEYFAEKYSVMRRHIKPHAFFVDATNVEQLRQMDFVFICIDSGNAKKLIVEKLEEFECPFIDVGMGVYEVDGSLAGGLRVTASTQKKRDHVRKRLSLVPTDVDDEYSRNIQIADLNALNAALAVIKWKKLFGFYADLDNENHCTYTLNGNALLNEDHN